MCTQNALWTTLSTSCQIELMIRAANTLLLLCSVSLLYFSSVSSSSSWSSLISDSLYPSLTQSPYVPVCNISKAVRQPGQGKHPSAGFRGWWGTRCFSSGTQGPPETSGWGRRGARGKTIPLVAPQQEHTLTTHPLSLTPFCLLYFFLLPMGIIVPNLFKSQ